MLSNCFKQNSSTMGMNDCYAKEYQSWDSELNRAYNALGGSNNEGLKIAQRDWIRFRDSQLNYLKAEFDNRQGTKWILEYDVLRNRLIKEQVERLQIIYHTDN
ncbi:lysozyme inhibitor LprI family protein [Vibrio ezurae]|uniref:lysozyme inhibitor LprI family protein n=1 Tax=Vibrio ezurae TaxID=252583 RepID=UPI0034E25ACB